MLWPLSVVLVANANGRLAIPALAGLLVNNCDGNDAKQRVVFGRLLVALKRAGCVVCWL